VSTGGSVGFAVLLLGLVVGIMIAQPNVNEAMEDLREARSGIVEEVTALKGLDISMSAEHNNTSGELTIAVVNVGSEVIDREDMDLIVDGVMISPSEVPYGILYPGDEMDLRLNNVSRPSSIRVVCPYGVTFQTGSGTITYR
jgi:archaellum component FlaF (FlaF/FlaG flagellin family)